jgi:pantetheine-phosphate adenylyltransferase
MTERVGLYPGTFDPITTGHQDIIKRSLRVVDRLVVAVAINAGKGPLFDVDERVALTTADLKTLGLGSPQLEVRKFDSLLMHFAHEVGATVIIRGLRAVSDFEYEFQMAGMNTRIDPDVETVFLMASEGQHFIASRLVKEIASLGGDISSFVSPAVARRLTERFGTAAD